MEMQWRVYRLHQMAVREELDAQRIDERMIKI